MGFWALLFPTRRGRALLRIADADGAWLFAVDGLSLAELRRGVEVVRSSWRAAPAS